MDTALLDERLPCHVVEKLVVLLVSFGRDRYHVFLLFVSSLILWLNGKLPVTFEHLLDARLAYLIPLVTQAIPYPSLESLVNEDTSAESACVV